MKCPLCQNEVRREDALPYMAIKICPACWELKNPQNTNEALKPISSEHKKQKNDRNSILYEEILLSLNSIERKLATNNSIKIVDLNMPFLSMVIFMVKWAIASIPAMILLFIIGGIISTIFGGLFAVFLR